MKIVIVCALWFIFGFLAYHAVETLDQQIRYEQV